MQTVSQLGYLGLEVSDLGAWERFAGDALGLGVVARSDSMLELALDDYAHRFLLVPGASDDVAFVGWEAPHASALDAVVARLRAAGHEVVEAPPADAAARKVARLFRTRDPDGVAIELHCGPAMARELFRSAVVPSGFKAGALGLGHIVLAVGNRAESERFYCECIGLRLSDRIETMLGGVLPLEIAFLHANPRHHSLALVEAPLPKRLHHFMIEANAMDEVGRAYDRFLAGGLPISQTLGRHPNDLMFSFYGRTPSGFDVEFGWGGREVDDATWEARTYDALSLWGHRPASG